MLNISPMQEMTSRPIQMSAFAAVTLAPVGLVLAGAALGGAWPWLALAYMGALPVLIDRLAPRIAPDAAPGAEFPGADALLAVIAICGVCLLPIGVLAIGRASGPWQGLALFLTIGFWLGQVLHPAAHELIHRPGRGLFRLGVLAYTAMLFGQHASAHRLVHHLHVATPLDPNSARSGEGFYRFALRAWIGSFRQGWQAEDALRARAGQATRPPHPFAIYIAGAVLALALALAIGGVRGMLIWALLCLHAQSQILLSDYVQHYGLTRARLPSGRYEPVGPAHSWNAAEWFSSALMLNAPRHSDHHAHPARPYPALRLPQDDSAPRLPWPLPLACMIALFPPLFKRRIRPALLPWIARAKAASQGPLP